MIDFAWLSQDVPLWALLVAAFTSPALWSEYVKRAVSTYYERKVGDGGDA